MVTSSSFWRISRTRSTPGLPEGPQTPQIGAPNCHCGRPSSEGLEHVRPASHSTVHDDGYSAIHGLRHFGKCVDRRAAATLGSAPVVRDPYGVHAVFYGERGVFVCDQAFHDDALVRDLPEPANEIPCHGGGAQIAGWGGRALVHRLHWGCLASFCVTAGTVPVIDACPSFLSQAIAIRG